MKRMAIAVCALSAACLAEPSEPRAEEPVEYVRICDAFGSDFFYIPGTDTCLRIGGRVNLSYIENPNKLGGGTVVDQQNVEGFGFSVKDWLNRVGFGASFEYGLGRDALPSLLGDGAYGFLYGDFAYAEGDAKSSGKSEVGVAGVTKVGLTLGQQDPIIGTGVGATTPGFGLKGWSKLDNSWGIGTFGAGHTYMHEHGEYGDIGYVVRLGGYVEQIEFDSRGRSKLTFNGNPFDGFYQRFDYESRDTYAGAVLGLDFLYQPIERVQFTVGYDLLTGYHWGSGDFRMTTGVGGGNTVVENFNYENNGLTLGGTLKVAVDVGLGADMTIGGFYKGSIVPEVTAANKPSSPLTQPFFFESKNIQRHEVGAEFRWIFE